MRLPVHKFSSSHLIKLRGKETEIKYIVHRQRSLKEPAT